MIETDKDGKMIIRLELSPGEASVDKLRQYGNVAMPAVPIPKRFITLSMNQKAEVRSWIIIEGKTTLLISDLTEAIK